MAPNSRHERHVQPNARPAAAPRMTGNRNDNNPNNPLRKRCGWKLFMSISMPTWNIMYSRPSLPINAIVGVLSNTPKAEAPSPTPVRINPTIAGTCIFLQIRGTSRIVTRITSNMSKGLSNLLIVFICYPQVTVIYIFLSGMRNFSSVLPLCRLQQPVRRHAHLRDQGRLSGRRHV